MIYLKTINKTLAQDFYSLLKAKIKNDYWIKEVILREVIISFKNERVEYSEWIVEVKTIKDKELSVFSNLAQFSELEAREMIDKGELIFSQD